MKNSIKIKAICFMLFSHLGFIKAQNTFPTAVNTFAGIGTTTPAAPLEIKSSATPVTSFTTCWIENFASSATASIAKVGLDIQSTTGAWNGASAVNIGLNVHVADGTINYSALFTGGNVGIGTGNPNELLTVAGGNVDVNSNNKSYMINGVPVIWWNAEPTNIFVGVNTGITGQHNSFLGYTAGNSTTGDDNTYLGYSAGFANTTGASNAFVGSLAGSNNDVSNFSTMVGASAGVNSDADGNTFIGYSSGTNSIDGEENTFVGNEAGIGLTHGELNAGLGSFAGSTNTTGNDNVYVGYLSGDNNTTGSENVFVGHNARTNTGAHGNAIAVGANSQVMNSNQMILGDNSINVGIGLSGNATGPQNKLEINQGTSGNSGLRFTQMTSSSSSSSANGKVLTVNSSGDVILVPDANSGGNVSACTSPTPAINLLTKWVSPTPATNTVCNSIIYDDGTRVGVSTTGPIAKFDVRNTVGVIGVRASSTSAALPINVGVAGMSESATNFNIGVLGNSPQSISFSSIPAVNFGSGTPVVNAVSFNAGVVGLAQGSQFNFGGIFEANQCGTGVHNYGVYASGYGTVAPSCGPDIAGFFQGQLFSIGPLQQVSDSTFKDSVKTINDALTTISHLSPKTFVFKTSAYPYLNLPLGKQYGLIAQQVDTVLPELVHKVMQPQITDTAGTILQDTMTFKSLDYSSLIPLTIRAIQQLDSFKVSSNTSKADSNHVVKWGTTTDKTLVNSLIYDNGSRVGIPSVQAGSYVYVLNHNDTIATNFTSDNSATRDVIRASYSTNGNAKTVAAVSGYSKYVDASSADNGIGGDFEGGFVGAHGMGSGTGFVSIGLQGEAQNGSFLNMGVVGTSQSTTASGNAGVFASARGSSYQNYALLANAESVSSTADNAGVNAAAGKSTYQNFGGKFNTTDTSGINYGIYTSVGGSSPKYYAGYFNGDVHATGTVTWTSDARLKTNIQPINSNDALASVLKLEPKTYSFKTSDYPYLTLPKGGQYGLLAQDVEQVLPQLVSDIIQPETHDKDGNQLSPQFQYKGLNYTGIIPLLVGAVKKQQAKIDSLSDVINTRLNDLENRVNGCCGTGMSGKTDGTDVAGTANPHRVSVELGNMQVVVLEQNVPNPFAEQTSISYYIPDGVQSAQMVFADMMGTVVKTVEVEKGYGIMTVFASNLSGGQYTYTLITDGKIAETKRMVKAK